MMRRRILVVDDELINLEIINEYLGDENYDLDLISSADRAWQHLCDNGTRYDLAILDRMMPGMDGIELLRRMKADVRLRAIPVIMQTAASAPEQMREGIAAGAYYYLAKPYEPEVLLAIVQAACADVKEREESNRHASAHVKAMELMDLAIFQFRALEEVGPLLEVLASLCPDPAAAAAGLSELLVNAVEHGNLGIKYAEKKRLRLEGGWEGEVARRIDLPEYRDRRVRVRVERHADRIEFTVADEGAGFDWQRYLDFDPGRASDPNGRGIAMARLLSFIDLAYTGNGNTVIATVRNTAHVA